MTDASTRESSSRYSRATEWRGAWSTATSIFYRRGRARGCAPGAVPAVCGDGFRRCSASAFSGWALAGLRRAGCRVPGLPNRRGLVSGASGTHLGCRAMSSWSWFLVSWARNPMSWRVQGFVSLLPYRLPFQILRPYPKADRFCRSPRAWATSQPACRTGIPGPHHSHIRYHDAHRPQESWALEIVPHRADLLTEQPVSRLP